MATIVTRAGKGSPLTNTEVDSNFTNLNTDKQEILSEGAFVNGDKSKLDGIEALADVTDTANVTAAGALMDSELTDIAAVKALNQGVATTDEPSWDGVNLNAISTSIADTAVDVFVYDTRKDSDGGAWRKRTQHTSWYNETLNTATRGSRKEFPAVAVIVGEASQVTIYDGDDPDLPMWMVFNAGNGQNYINTNGNNVSSIEMLNALLVYGGATDGLCGEINFIDETVIQHTTGGSVFAKSEQIALRNTSGNIVYTSGIEPIVSQAVNDIAMTVLPNAPIDDATGLPIPTIAVATDGGVSVIKDDGSVVDLKTTSTYTGSNNIDFLDDGRIAFSAQQSSASTAYYRYLIAPIPASDLSSGYWQDFADDVIADYAYGSYSNGPYLSTHYSLGGSIDALSGKAVGGYLGVGLLDEDKQVNTNGMTAHIRSNYNTGWMNGDIKLATLSDTDATNVTGSELVTNGTFDTDTSGWTASNATLSVVSGKLRITATAGGARSEASQTITTVAGATYTISATDIVDASTSSARLELFNGGTPIVTTSGTGSLSMTFVAPSTSTTIDLAMGSDCTTGDYIEFDNISVRLAEEDRSVNGNGLQVFGTVTKNPVATGADLVAYSGFSASNYLQQPYNSDLDFGTGDFCIMGWVKRASGTYGTGVLLGRKDASNTDGFVIFIDSSNQTNFYTRESSTNSTLTSSFNISDGTWHFITAVRKSSGTVQELYIDGVINKTEVVTARNISNSTAKARIGLEAEGTYAPFTDGLLALMRISATAPSAEQIKKIYEDEKVLFQENAQATLYGSSDAVTALAYDDDTNLLHVGTSAGRSVFQGLRRVDNTTSAVGAAISASNGLVAED